MREPCSRKHALGVGGWLEGVPLGLLGYGFIDEEGKLRGLPVNAAATRVVAWAMPGFADVIAGPMITTGPPDGAEATDVTDELVELVERAGLSVV